MHLYPNTNTEKIDGQQDILKLHHNVLVHTSSSPSQSANWHESLNIEPERPMPPDTETDSESQRPVPPDTETDSESQRPMPPDTETDSQRPLPTDTETVFGGI